MNQRGGASVLLLAVIMVTALLGAAVASTGAYLNARTRAATAADAAALAAAPVTFAPFGGDGDPVAEAAGFAAANGARLVSCRCPVDRSWEPRTVRVVVEVAVRLWPLGTVEVDATSRAEFIPALLLG